MGSALCPRFADPEAIFRQHRTQLEQLAKGQLSRPAGRALLKALGKELYRELFSEQMKAAYRVWRARAHTLLITSDEPWIPWEMFCPHEDRNGYEPFENDFLCLNFRVTRWLTGTVTPATIIPVSRVCCLAVPAHKQDEPLPFTELERGMIAKLAARHGLEDLTPPTADRAALEKVLAGAPLGILHFATHGETPADDPGGASIQLIDQRVSARELGELTAEAVRHPRSLIFLNACGTGQPAWGLTRVGGWAETWIERCQCGVFVGTLWPVNDNVARRFAQHFYTALFTQASLAEATQLAREKLRQADPDNPSWLAYTVYGHPLARLRVGRLTKADENTGPAVTVNPE
jgi:hypothetical protein